MLRFIATRFLLTAAIAASVAQTSVLVAQPPQFRADALAVRVDVLVMQGRKPAAGLTAREFELRDNGVVQKVDVIEASSVPLNVILALDMSASVAGRRQEDLTGASEALLDGLRPVDRAALTTFNHAVLPPGEPTADLGAIRRALRGITPTGRTSLMDGVYVAMTATLAQPERSLVLVCSDGTDVTSWLRPTDVMEVAKRSNAVVYAVTPADASRATTLRALTDATGGEVFRATSSREVRDTFRRILEEFRSRYVLAYTPAGVALGGLHRLEVRVTRSGATVKARPSYVGLHEGVR